MATATSNQKRTAVCGLGEIALRVNDLDAMQKFYEEVIALPLMTRVPNCAFFKIADGYGGHPQVFALFDRSQNPNCSTIFQSLQAIEFGLSHCCPKSVFNFMACRESCLTA